MCRYVAYLGEPMLLSNVLYNPANSLILQASDAMESRTRINADGFGIGWYNPSLSPEPAVFKEVSPAWNNANLRSLADKVASPCIFAHVRAAPRYDTISRSNCHPFHFGELLWMHNGDIPARGRLHRRVVSLAAEDLVARISGNTDSELAFVLFLTFLGEARNRPCTAEDLAGAMQRTVDQISEWWIQDREQSRLALNFCVTNGRSLVALRYGLLAEEVPSLHFCRGSSFVCDADGCRVQPGGNRRCLILASEVLTRDPEWVTLDNGNVIVAHDVDTVELRGTARPTVEGYMR